MTPFFRALVAFVISLVRSRVSLQVEIVALRHQLALYRRSIRRPPILPSDRMLWAWFARHWSHWREVLIFVQPGEIDGTLGLYSPSDDPTASGRRRSHSARCAPPRRAARFTDVGWMPNAWASARPLRARTATHR